MTSDAERTKKAAEFARTAILLRLINNTKPTDVSEVYEGGNTEDEHTFTFELDGEEYNVQVCAGVLYDDEDEERG